ncbi:MAG: right-handed parallel beta-helix repeat-containing protein [Roseburia sp.]|nr:right-handed parallel beta-helix repeat-containing protein [Roseburia sp.]
MCKFDTCNIGLNSDGAVALDVYRNYFYTTRSTGLRFTRSYRSSAHDNVFYKCRGDAIGIDGVATGDLDQQQLFINVYANKILGGKIGKGTDENGNEIYEVENQTSIHCNGAKDVVIRDNIIRDMTFKSGTPNEGDYGIGILMFGNGSTVNERVIVSNNIISGCMRYGIKVNYSDACTVSGNQISGSVNTGIITDYSLDCVFSDNSVYGRRTDNTDTGDYGIKNEGNTFGNVFSNNYLYEYNEDNGIVINAVNFTALNQNTLMNSAYSHGIISNHRVISNPAISASDSSNIVIPDQITFNNGEIFYLYIPENYNVTNLMQLSIILYKNGSGYVYDDGDAIEIPDTYRGKYIRLRFTQKDRPTYISYFFTIV